MHFAAGVTAFAADGVANVIGNPFSALTGQPVGDPHAIEWKGRPGHFRKCSVLFQNSSGTLDLWIVAKGGAAELCRIDWFSLISCR